MVWGMVDCEYMEESGRLLCDRSCSTQLYRKCQWQNQEQESKPVRRPHVVKREMKNVS